MTTPPRAGQPSQLCTSRCCCFPVHSQHFASVGHRARQMVMVVAFVHCNSVTLTYTDTREYIDSVVISTAAARNETDFVDK